MTQEARLVALAQAIGADVKALREEGGGGSSQPSSVSVTYNAQGRLETVTEDGITKTITRNAAGRIATISGGGRTETYSYDANGKFTGMIAT